MSVSGFATNGFWCQPRKKKSGFQNSLDFIISDLGLVVSFLTHSQSTALMLMIYLQRLFVSEEEMDVGPTKRSKRLSFSKPVDFNLFFLST